MKKNIYVVGAIIIENGRILCAQRGPGRSLANFWEFPGGKIETGETPHEALKREIDEELKIKVDVNKTIFDEVSYEYDFGIVHLTTFLCRLKGERPTLTEHIDAKWLKPEEISSLDWAPADIPIVNKLSKLALERD